MDYGKEAYAIATELDRRMGGMSKTFTASSVTFTGESVTGKEIKAAEYTGGAALIVLTVTSEGSGGCDVIFNGYNMGRIATGGSVPFVFAVDGQGDISIIPDDGVTVHDITAGAAGMNCSFAMNEKVIAADSNGANVYALANSDGLRLYGLSGGEFVSRAVYAEGVDFDVAVFGSGALVAVCDNRGNGELYLHSGENTIAVALIPDCLHISVAASGDCFIVAAYDGKRIRAMTFDGALNQLESTRVHGSSTVEKLALVKGSAFPSLAIADGGKVLVRQSAAETRGWARTAVSTSLTIGGL